MKGGITLTYPVDIFGHRTGAFAQWPSQNWTGWNVYWSQVAGQRLNMGGASAYIDHADAIGSTTMETDPAGGVQWKIAYYPWGQIMAQGGIRQSVVWAGLDWQINDPSIPSATREYNDGLGRWLTPDPDNAGAEVSDSQSWKMYAYVGDNPSSRSDPSGLSYCKRGSGGKLDLSSCVSDMAFPALDNKQGYVHASEDTTVTVNGSEATHNDYMFALGVGMHRAAPVVNATAIGLGAFATVVAPETLFEEAPMSLGLEGQPVIGKMADLEDLLPGERQLALPDQGTPELNWLQNERRLKQEMAAGRPIKDITALKYGPDEFDTGFLGKERAVLREAQWVLRNGYWYPPSW